jgi:glycerophosphoryl diester phosphodiesterase
VVPGGISLASSSGVFKWCEYIILHVVELVVATGHRGAAALEPEDTLRGIRRAIEIGVDRVEVDVHSTRDGRLILIHDETVDRTTNGHGRIRDLTFQEIRSLDAGKGEVIPTLEEAISMVKGKVTLQVELKEIGVEERTVRAVEEAGMVDEVVFTSFRHPALKTVKELNPSIRTGVLYYCLPIDPCRLALDAEAEAIHPNVCFVNEEMIRRAHALGIDVYAWNTDDEDEMRRLIRMGVDGLGSNRPDLLVKVIRESAQP